MRKKLLILSMAILVASTSLVGCDKLKGGKENTQASTDSEELSPDELGDLGVESMEDEFAEPSLDDGDAAIGDGETTEEVAPEPTEPKEEPKKEEAPKKKEKITVGDIKIPGGL